MASEIKVDTVSEKTSGSGVTIDGLLIKDGGISGDVSLIGTTPTFTIGDAGAEDATLVFDGNAQDFYIGLDDSADDLVIGLGSAVWTTPAISINEDRDVTISDGAIDFDVASHDGSNGLKLGGSLVTSTAAELNLLDGGTSVGSSITIADADGFVVNDGGSMKTIPASDIKTYNPGGTAWQSVVTGATTMVSGRGYFVNTTSSAFTMTLPASPSIGDNVSIIDYAGTFDSNTCTIGRNSEKIQGAAADMTVTTERAAFTLVYVDSTHGWLLTNK